MAPERETEIEKERERCEKEAVLLLTPPSLSLLPSLQDAECESRGGEKQAEVKASSSMKGKAADRDG